MDTDSHSLTQMETYLARTLRPVSAPPGLMHHLRRRIRLPEPGQIRQRVSDWYFFFIVASGVISAAVVLVTLVRVVYALTRRRA
jgi:hypothetical protein